MKTASACCRWVLCPVLSLLLVFPAGSWASGEGRGLVLDEHRGKKVALWVLAVGVSKYRDGRLNLKYADHDADRIAERLAAQERILYSDVHRHVLVNEDATREGILTAMSEFLGQASRNDVVLIFLAGHGLTDRKTGTYYFVPHNANVDNLIYAGLPMPMFNEAVQRLQTHVNKVILWSDTCHSGAIQVATRGLTAGEDLAEALGQATGHYVLSASMAGEESLEHDDYRFPEERKGHGAFTPVLLQGLQGEAADSTGVVWISDLFGYVNKEVPKLTKGRQHPHFELRGTDLPLFVVGPSREGPGTVAELPETIVGEPTEPGQKDDESGGGTPWWWLLLGAAAAGAVGGAAAGGVDVGGGGKDTGEIVIETPLPE